jgi:hypothetical protein
MSEENSKHDQSRTSVSYSELQAIVSSAVAEAVKAAIASQSANTTALAEAIKDSKKPYEDPKQKANDAAMRKSMIAAKEQEKKRTEYFQNNVCPHTMGSSESSARALPDSSFAVHVLDTGEVVGVCTNCQKVISSQVQEDARWFAKKGGNIRSAAGQRTFVNSYAAQRVRLGLDQKEIFIDEKTGEAVGGFPEPTETVPAE